MESHVDHSTAPHNPLERIAWLRAEASALLSEALELRETLPFPPEHVLELGTGCIICERCRLEIVADTERNLQTEPRRR
jgi:hypothetical protein